MEILGAGINGISTFIVFSVEVVRKWFWAFSSKDRKTNSGQWQFGKDLLKPWEWYSAARIGSRSRIILDLPIPYHQLRGWFLIRIIFIIFGRWKKRYSSLHGEVRLDKENVPAYINASTLFWNAAKESSPPTGFPSWKDRGEFPEDDPTKIELANIAPV